MMIFAKCAIASKTCVSLFFCSLSLLACAPIQQNIKTWNTKDTARQIVVSGTLIADWSMTDYTALHPESRKELNPILGQHPSTDAVAVYFASAIVGHAVISAALPQNIHNKNGDSVKIFGIEVNPRAIWQYFWIGAEAVSIVYSW